MTGTAQGAVTGTARLGPQELALAILDQVRMHPETHDQNSWHGGNFPPDPSGQACGTTHCVAGWAEVLMGKRITWEPTKFAQAALGLGDTDAYRLFYGTTEPEAVHALEYLAKGDRIDWEIVPRTRISPYVVASLTVGGL